MNRNQWTGGLAVGLLITGSVACSSDSPVSPSTTPSGTAAQVAGLGGSDSSSNDGSTLSAQSVGRTSVWADQELFDTVVTPATFDPAHGNFDRLYASGMDCSFKDGVGLISESKPGDQDYNGGRWELDVLKPDVECDKYDDVNNDAALDEGDFMPGGAYFECPLLPRRGRGRP